MRSSKSRSRSKPNRPRTLGNITNRVFDSSGPEGKVRGTPQQIIDKYLVLAREAQLSNDRVNAESCMQFAEHYTRMLGEATREMQAEQDARRLQENQNQQRDYQPRDRGDGQQPDLRDTRNEGGRNESGRDDDRNNDRNNTPREDRNGDRTNERRDAPREDRSNDRRDSPREDRSNERRDAPREDRSNAPREDRSGERRNRQVQRPEQETTAAAVIETPKGEDDSGLVETPETRRPRQHRQPRPKPVEDAGSAPVSAVEQPTASEGEKPARKTRAPRKPKPDTGSDTGPDKGNEAAE